MARRVLEKNLREKLGVAEPAPIGVCKTLEERQAVSFHNTFKGIYSLQFNYDGSALVVGFGAGGIQVYDPETGQLMKELRACRQGGDPVMVIRFHPLQPNILYAATTEGLIYVYNCVTGDLMQTIEETGNEINALDFCVDGFNFATGGSDLNIRVYETKQNKCIKTYEGVHQHSVSKSKMKLGITMRVFAVKFHPSNQFIFLSGGWDNHIKIWDIRDAEGIKRNIKGPHICGDAIDIKENKILTGQWTALHSLQEYNYTNGSVIREINFPHTDGAFLYCAAYVSDNYVIAGGSGTKSAEVIEISTNRHVGGFKLESPVQAIDTANLGRSIAIGGNMSQFYILTLKS